MNKPIKFRGKRTDNRMWVEGFLDFNPIQSVWIIHVIEDLPPTQSDPGGDIYSERFEVDPSTVGQLIDFTDKNGKEIWEDDIINFRLDREPKWRTGRVFWMDNYLQYGIGCYYTAVKDIPDYSFRLYEPRPEIEVIGNVFDNPKYLIPTYYEK